MSDPGELLRGHLGFWGAVCRSISHEMNNVTAILIELAGLMQDRLAAAGGQAVDGQKTAATLGRMGTQLERARRLMGTDRMKLEERVTWKEPDRAYLRVRLQQMWSGVRTTREVPRRKGLLSRMRESPDHEEVFPVRHGWKRTEGKSILLWFLFGLFLQGMLREMTGPLLFFAR